MRPQFLLAAVVMLAGPAQAAAPRAAAVAVEQAWSRPAAAGMTGAGFMTLVNRGRAPITLAAIETPLAARVEVHRTRMRGDVASMERVDGGLVVPAGGTVRFAPGGYHLMLVGLKSALKAGDTAPATLVFSDGRRLKVDFEVRIAPPAADWPHVH